MFARSCTLGDQPTIYQSYLDEVILQQPAGRQAENREVGNRYERLLLDAEIELAVFSLG
jgi:hypothetical protein